MTALLVMTAPHSPTVRARRLGHYLRTMRESHRLDFKTVAGRLEVHHTTIRRIEKGLHKTDVDILEGLLDVYGVTDPQRRELLYLAENAWRRGWWQEYSDVLDDTFACLEDEAHSIRSWQTQFVPGLLQTSDYARALISAGTPELDAGEIEQRVDAREKRTKLLSRSPAPQLHAVLSEAALRQEVGGKTIMKAQLHHLLELGERENVTVQILPFTAGAHPGMSGAFVIFGFAHEDDPDVAYTENLAGSAYSESETALRRFRLAWGDVVDAALPSDKSADLIAALTQKR